VPARGGRLVKLIGDEVMFVALDAAVACDTALALFEHFASDASVTPRGALATGGRVTRGGAQLSGAPRAPRDAGGRRARPRIRVPLRAGGEAHAEGLRRARGTPHRRARLAQARSSSHRSRSRLSAAS